MEIQVGWFPGSLYIKLTLFFFLPHTGPPKLRDGHNVDCGEVGQLEVTGLACLWQMPGPLGAGQEAVWLQDQGSC